MARSSRHTTAAAKVRKPHKPFRAELVLHTRTLPVQRRALAAFLSALIASIPAQPRFSGVSSLTLLLTDDAEIQQLNRDFRGKDKPTDVLSFPFAGSRAKGESYLGDLAISVETLRQQAKEYRVTTNQELIRLVIHGTLHLFGYDHEKVPARKAQRMRRLERRLNAKFAAVRLISASARARR